MWRNCTVCLAGIMALGGVGCVIDGSDHGQIRVRWDLQYFAGDPASCDPGGADTPSVLMVTTNVATGEKFSATFLCPAKMGVMGDLPAGGRNDGVYDVSLSLLDPQKRVVAVVDYQDIQVRHSGVTEPAVAPFLIQAWELSWVVMRAGPGGKPLASDCRAAAGPGAKVELAWQLGGEPPESVLFNCEPLYNGTSPAIRTGLYQAQVRLLDAGGRALSDTGFMSQRVTGDKMAAIDVELVVQQ